MNILGSLHSPIQIWLCSLYFEYIMFVQLIFKNNLILSRFLITGVIAIKPFFTKALYAAAIVKLSQPMSGIK